MNWYKQSKRHRPPDAVTFANPPLVGFVDYATAVFTSVDDSCFGIGERFKTHKDFFPNYKVGHGRFRIDEENEIMWLDMPSDDEMIAVDDYCADVLHRPVKRHTDVSENSITTTPVVKESPSKKPPIKNKKRQHAA